MICTWSKGSANLGMPETILLDMAEKVHRHPWWKARASLAVALLAKYGVLPPARVADIGCGWGTNLVRLERSGYSVTGLDVSRRTLEMLDRPQRSLIEADLNQEFPAEALAGYSACLLLDVIEHLEDDRAAITHAARLLEPDGICIVSVPALPRLFSTFDRLQGHRRRYLPDSLRNAFANTGLTPVSIFWWGFWMLPVLGWTRGESPRASDAVTPTYADYLRLPPWPGPQLMGFAYAIEKPFAMNGWLPRGTSLFAVARRCS